MPPFWSIIQKNIACKPQLFASIILAVTSFHLIGHHLTKYIIFWWLFWVQVFVALEDPTTFIILIEDTLVLPVFVISWLVVIFLGLRQVGDITASQWPVKPWPFVLCCRIRLTTFRSAVIFAIVIIILVLSRLEIEASSGRCTIILNLIVIALVVESIVFYWGVKKWVACNFCIYSFVVRTERSRRCTVILIGSLVSSS